MFNLEPQAVAAILGASVVGVFALLSQSIILLGQWLARRQEAHQREREWFRQQLLETYGNCLRELYRIIACGEMVREGETRDLGECQRYLLQLAAYCRDERRQRIIKLASEQLARSWDKSHIGEPAKRVAEQIRDLMWEDERIQALRG
jgi:hypothetical protein